MRNDRDENFTYILESSDQAYLFTALEELGFTDFAVSGGGYQLREGVTPPEDTALIDKVNQIKLRHPTNKLRNLRNRLLTESDWVVSKYTESGQEVPTDWITYRQGLRDITTQTPNDLSLSNIIWPTKPE